MSNYFLSSELAALVFSYSRKAGNLHQDYLFRPLGSSFDTSMVDVLLIDIEGLRFALSLHCKSKSCDYSADEAQNLFHILHIAKSLLERIK